MTVAALAALLCMLLTGLLPAQACPTCLGKGLLPCPACAALEAGALCCTLAAACARCQGALAVACPDCSTAAGAGLQRRRKLAQDYRSDLEALLAANKVDARGVMQCRTEHFELLFAPGRIDGCPQTDPHLQLHFYAARLEQMHARLCTVLGMSAAPLQQRPRIALVKDERAARRLCAALTGLEAQGLGGGVPHTLVLQQTAATSTDGALQRLLAHQVAHLSTAGLALDAHGYGWLELGIAHWLEADQGGGRCENFCLQHRPQPPQQFWDGDWKTGVRELREGEGLPPLSELFDRDADDFDFVQHAEAFAFVDFLLQQPAPPLTHQQQAPPPPLQRLMTVAPLDQPASKVLPEVLGKDVAGIDAAFRAFVVRRYPRK